MAFHRLAAAAVLSLALAACGDRNKAATTDDDDGAPAVTSSAPAPPAQAAAPAPAAPGTDETTLAANDEKMASGQYYDTYPLGVEARDGWEISVNARGFKPVVILLDSNRQPVSQTEPLTRNGDGSWTATLTESFDAAGSYYVLVSADEVGATGSYTVDARKSRPLD